MDFIKKEKKKPKGIKAFSIDVDLYSGFRDECKDRNLNMSEIIGEFLRRVVLLLKDKDGGEVVFGVEGDNWKQPVKVVYDGVEITERGGVRQTKKEAEIKL